MDSRDSQQLRPYFTKSGVGKLFKDPKPIAKHRWPRGFTPERKQEVQQALPPIKVDRSRPGRGPHQGEITSRITEDVARSTMPAEHLTGLGAIGVSSLLRGGTAHGVYRETAVPEKHQYGYVPIRKVEMAWGEQNSRRPDAEIIPRSREEFGSTLIHELGHHVSYTANPNAPQREATRTPSGISGWEEAKADDYRVQHYRQDPRAARKRPLNIESTTYSGRGIDPPGYQESRQVLGQQFEEPTKPKILRGMDLPGYMEA